MVQPVLCTDASGVTVGVTPLSFGHLPQIWTANSEMIISTFPFVFGGEPLVSRDGESLEGLVNRDTIPTVRHIERQARSIPISCSRVNAIRGWAFTITGHVSIPHETSDMLYF